VVRLYPWRRKLWDPLVWLIWWVAPPTALYSRRSADRECIQFIAHRLPPPFALCCWICSLLRVINVASYTLSVTSYSTWTKPRAYSELNVTQAMRATTAGHTTMWSHDGRVRSRRVASAVPAAQHAVRHGGARTAGSIRKRGPMRQRAVSWMTTMRMLPQSALEPAQSSLLSLGLTMRGNLRDLPTIEGTTNDCRHL